MTLKHCNGCGEDKELSEFYIYKSGPRMGTLVNQCKKCGNERSANWQKANPKKANLSVRNYSYRTRGGQPATENRSCSLYLGCVIAETVLTYEFPGFKRMPPGNPDYDYECPKGFLIDVKSACRSRHKNGTHDHWHFNIKTNKVPHFYLCIAWKDRETLVPEHLWLIPGYLVNEKVGFDISDSLKSLARWSKYERLLNNVIECCDKLRGDA